MKFYHNNDCCILGHVVLYKCPEGQEIMEEITMEMKLSKKQIETLNNVAKEDFDKARAMLDGINMVLGTHYDWIAKRVVWFEDAYGKVAHDAWAWAE